MFKFLLYILIVQITTISLANQESNKYELRWFESKKETEKGFIEKFDVISSVNENYTCYISKEEPRIISTKSTYEGPAAIDFIEHLFNKKICSYRLDPYWTYEICHGKSIKQYHEVLDGPRFKLQQYTLGKMGVKEREILLRIKKEEEINNMKNSSFKSKTKRVRGKNLPYVEIEMADGSVCEHNRRKRRKSYIYYMCDLKSHHAIEEVKEIASCVYEIIILTSLLCAHPEYRPKVTLPSPIECYAKGSSPKIPYNLAKVLWERKRIIDKAEKDEHKIGFSKEAKDSLASGTDKDFISDFLKGKNCFLSGTGDWKYEFCFGKYLNQYINGVFGLKTTVCLGKFVLDKHLQWIKDRPYKRPKPLGYRKYITQFYTDGSISNITGRHRQTEVKLKCMENSSNRNALVMYMYETYHGEYLLGVESPILCHVISLANEDGVIL